MQTPHPYGRIDADGTVYLRTADGERIVGSWQAGSPDEGLRHFERRFVDLAAQVELLAQRLQSGVADPASLRASAQRLRGTVASAPVVGDVGALEQRLTELTEIADRRIAERTAERAAAREQILDRLRALAEEAESLAGSSSWKATGERFRTLAEDWRALVRGSDRKVSGELWRRIAAAREEFHRRRSEHFAALAAGRDEVRRRKEQLVTEAESLTDSREWGPTAGRFRQLVADWKEAGRADKAAEDALWGRFSAAQRAFFDRRSAALAERSQQWERNLQTKESLLAAAEQVDPAGDRATARRALRTLQERWAETGPVPPPARAALADRLSAAEGRLRAGADAAPPLATESSPFVQRLRESVDKLERRAARARAAGRAEEAAEAEAALATQRAWLARAGQPGRR
jgi:hypothetical protein